VTEGGSPFDRVRPRTRPGTDPGAPGGRERRRVPRDGTDVEGKRALFSPSTPQPAPGGISLTCSVCEQRSVLTVGGALRAAVPSLHLPFLARLGARHTSWMRCPACGRRTWVRLHLRP
jgi:hypothetical protein